MSPHARLSLAAAALCLLLGAGAGVAAEPPQALSLRSPNLPAHELVEAAAYWQGACAETGVFVPRITVGGPGLPVEIRRSGDSWSPNRRCGMTSVRRRDGEVVAYVIDVFVRQRNGTPCFPLFDEVAHELGHVLGLPDDPRLEAMGTIMGVRPRNDRRRVESLTCSRVAAIAASRGQAVASLRRPQADTGPVAPARERELLPSWASPLDWALLDRQGPGGVP